MVSFDEVAEWAAAVRAERLPAEVRLAAARERESVRATIVLTQQTEASPSAAGIPVRREGPQPSSRP